MSFRSHDRRDFFKASGAAALGAVAWPSSAEAQATPDLPAPIAALRPMTDGVMPITTEERRIRVAKAQELLKETGLQAVIIASGSSLEYFTGAR